MITIGYNVGRIYVSTAGAPTPQLYIDDTPVPADVIASISDPVDATSNMISATTEGQLMAAHRDHGDTGGWSHPSFNSAHLDKITGKTPTMFYSVNCLTGQFDLTAPIRESFAEKILRMKGAAPSLIAATRVSHTWLNNDLMKGLFDAMWGGVLPTFPSGIASYPIRRNRLGDILNYGKVYLTVALSGSSEYIKDQFEIYHIVGDPTLEIWRTKPLRARISAWVRGRYLYIRLYRVIKDSVLTLWSEEKMFRRLEPSSTFIKITLPWSVDLQKLFICYWAPGYRFRLIRPLSRLTSPL
jgi:hypothetical protein